MQSLTPSQGLTLLTPWLPDQRDFFINQYSTNLDFRQHVNNKVEDYIRDPFVLVSADASQAEVRIVAELSGEQKLLDLYKRQAEAEAHGIDTEDDPDYDVHCMTASHIEGRAVGKKDPKRRPAKTVTFAVLYGAGEWKIAETTGMSTKEAKALLRAFWKTYPRIRKWCNELIAQAVKYGYVTTPIGRRKAVPILQDKIDVLRCFVGDISLYDRKDGLWSKYDYTTIKQIGREIRQARNFPVQSYASDLVFNGAYFLLKACEDEGIQVVTHTLVHDALVASVRLSQLHRYLELLKYNMETKVMQEFNVGCPLKIESEVGFSYASMVKLPGLLDKINFEELPIKMFDKWSTLNCKTILTFLAKDSTYLFDPENRKVAQLTSMEQKNADIKQKDFEESFVNYKSFWNLDDTYLEKRKEELSNIVVDKVEKQMEQYLN